MRILSVLALIVSFALAQEPRGSIAGRVLDPSGAVVPRVEVTATNLAANTKIAAASNERGNYLLPYLLPGLYRLTAQAPGFKTYSREPIEVRINDRLQVDIPLELGQPSESVTVTAGTPLLDTANASVGQVVDQRRLSDLPILHSNPMLLMQLSPAAVSVALNMGFLDTRSSDNVRLTEYAIAGTPANTHEVTLDGVSNTTTSAGVSPPNLAVIPRQRTIAFVPPADTVDEFRIDTAQYDAAVGAAPAALIAMNLKSGTNTLHGTARYFKTNPGWNANDYFSNLYGRPRAFLQNSHWVATGSGPLVLPKLYNGKDRTFIMYGFERQKDDAPWAGGVYSVPTLDERRGDFSSLLKIKDTYQIYDPATAARAPNGRLTRQPFPGNLIPADRINPVAKKLMEYYPAPRVTGLADGTLNYPYPDLLQHATTWSHSGRIDHNLTDKYRLFFRGYWGDMTRDYRDYFENLSTGLLSLYMNRGATLDQVYMFRPNLVLNLRYGITRFLFPHTPHSQGMDLSTLGFPASLISQVDRRGATFPLVSINGLSNLGPEKPDDQDTTTHNLNGTLNWVRGKHILRFGGDFRAYQENWSAYTSASPWFSFGTLWTQGPYDNSTASPGGVGQGFAAFLLGLPTGGGIGRDAGYSVSSPLLGAFVQDDWRVSGNLTLNLGVRYEVEGALTERYNRSASGMDFLTLSPLAGQAQANYAKNPTPELPPELFDVKGGLLFPGRNGAGRSLFTTPKKNFAPRIGFAYRAGDSTVIRAGYGIFFSFVGEQSGEKVKQYGFSRVTPFFASLDNGVTFMAGLDNPFPSGILEPVGAADGLNTYNGMAVSFFNQHPRTPYNQRWSFTVQRKLPASFLLEVGYLGNRSVALETSLDYKPFDPQYLSRAPQRDQKTIDYWTRTMPNPFYPMLSGTSLSASVVTRDLLYRMANFPQFTAVSSADNAGFSWYHGLESRLERRFSAGYTLQVGYTWSKYMNALARLNGQLSPLEKVISSYDRPHRFTISGIWELPNPRVARRVLGGWQVQGLAALQSGPPIGFGNALLTGSIKDIPLENQTIDRWFNTSVFNTNSTQQLAYNYRTLPSLFNGIRADGRHFLNASIIKAFQIYERVNLQLRAEAFNALNHPNFAAPQTSPTSAAFGQVSATNLHARVVQLGLKLAW